jgi:hypothetical protein
MKKLLLLLLCVPLMFSCGENENDLTRANIKGNVKEIVETYFDAKEVFGEPQKKNRGGKLVKKFNKDGNKTEWVSYDVDGEMTNKYKFQYDKNGNLTEEDCYNADGEMTGRGKFQCDEDGKKTEKIVCSPDGVRLMEYKYKYDENGNNTETTYYNVDGEMTNKDKYKYDEDGNNTETTYYNVDGEMINKNKYQYDDDGNKTEWVLSNSDGLEVKYKFQHDVFDKLKNWTVGTTYLDDKIKNITEREIEYYK